MYHVSAQGVDESMINVQYYYYYFCVLILTRKKKRKKKASWNLSKALEYHTRVARLTRKARVIADD